MRRILSSLFVVVAAALVTGCKSEAPPADVPKEPAAVSADHAAPADRATVLTRLVSADKLDGKEDKVVTKCYLCGLGMDGEEKFAAEYEGYTVHLCSDHCLEEFKKDPASVIARTDVPAN